MKNQNIYTFGLLFTSLFCTIGNLRAIPLSEITDRYSEVVELELNFSETEKVCGKVELLYNPEQVEVFPLDTEKFSNNTLEGLINWVAYTIIFNETKNISITDAPVKNFLHPEIIKKLKSDENKINTDELRKYIQPSAEPRITSSKVEHTKLKLYGFLRIDEKYYYPLLINQAFIGYMFQNFNLVREGDNVYVFVDSEKNRTSMSDYSCFQKFYFRCSVMMMPMGGWIEELKPYLEPAFTTEMFMQDLKKYDEYVKEHGKVEGIDF